jgi:hypothetical protein
VQAKAHIVAVGFDERELTEWARAKLRENLLNSPLRLVFTDAKSVIRLDKLSEDNLSARLNVITAGQLILDKDSSLIDKNVFLGKNAEQIKDYLSQVQGVEAVTIEFFPKWLKSIPVQSDKLSVVVQQQ